MKNQFTLLTVVTKFDWVAVLQIGLIVVCLCTVIINVTAIKSLIVLAALNRDELDAISALRIRAQADLGLLSDAVESISSNTKEQGNFRETKRFSINFDRDRATKIFQEVRTQLLPIVENGDESSLVVVLGVKFILDRDYSLWESTFENANFHVAMTSKKSMTRGEHSDWKVMQCLDLFDGKSHCIEPKRLLELTRDQRVSRIYGLRRTLWNKDDFCRTMSTALDGFENNMSREFVFPCWVLPGDFSSLINSASELHKDHSFILKPIDRGEGNGIVVMDNVYQLKAWKNKFPYNDEVVVQTYLSNPFLVNERKWDMRIYVLVTSVSPLRAYMYHDGLIRFATTKYNKNAKSGGKATSFLTNTSVNKKKGAAVDELTWPFPKMAKWLQQNGYDTDILWTRIEAAIVQMLLSSEPSFVETFEGLKHGFSCSGCYQLLGVDVIVDDLVTPRVIEVNGEPSMQLTGEFNSHYDSTKKSMARDLVSLMFSPMDTSEELSQDLAELQLQGDSIGFEWKGDCKPVDGSFEYCLSREDVEYLVEMKREEAKIGGFFRIYPSKIGNSYTPLVNHLKNKFPSNARIAGTFHLHSLLTKLSIVSKTLLNSSFVNSIYSN